MTVNQINRLAEEGIDSIATLAYSDPVKLFLKTDIEWVVIIDMIDQALLFNYLGDKLPLLRPDGIRGSIETAVIYERLKSADGKEIADAEEFVARIAEKLGMSVAEARNLIRTIWEDDQVNLLWQLFSDAYRDAGETDVEQSSGDRAEPPKQEAPAEVRAPSEKPPEPPEDVAKGAGAS